MFRSASLLLVAAVIFVNAVQQLPIHYTPSLAMQLRAEGKLNELKELRDRAEKNRAVLAAGSTPVIDYEDMAYMIQITLGTPAQTFVVFLDSGSGNLWVPDRTCASGQQQCGKYCAGVPYASCITFCDPSCCSNNKPAELASGNACASKHRFNSSASSTYVAQAGSFDITYQTGEVKGFNGQDTFCLAGSSICASKQGFGQATSIGGDFGKQPQDGIIGLGWPSIAVNNIVPPMFNLKNQGLLSQNIYTTYMAAIGPTSTINGGTFTAGGLDTTNCGPVNYIPLTSQTYWQFKMTSVQVGSFSSTPNAGWQVMSDTASTLIAGPTAIVKQIAKAVGAINDGFGSYLIDCEAETPDVILTINGQQYHIRAKNYVVAAGPGLCLFAFFGQDAGGFFPQWMLGPPLIREYCQVYDMQNAQIGMAQVLKQ